MAGEGSEQTVVVQIEAADTIELRREVLRDGRSDLSSSVEADDLESTVHLGIFEPRGGKPRGLIACVSLIAKPIEHLDCNAAILLTRMAVAAEYQRSGVGSQLLTAVQERCAEGGVWASARVSALGFYERHGFRIVSDEYEGAMGLAHRTVVWP